MYLVKARQRLQFSSKCIRGLIKRTHSPPPCLPCILPLLAQSAAHRLGHLPDNAVAYRDYLLIAHVPFQAFVGKLVGHGLLTRRNRLAPVDVKEFHLLEQGSASFANSLLQAVRCNFLRYHEGQVLHYRWVVTYLLHWPQFPTGLHQRRYTYIGNIDSRGCRHIEFRLYLRVEFAKDTLDFAVYFQFSTCCSECLVIALGSEFVFLGLEAESTEQCFHNTL